MYDEKYRPQFHFSPPKGWMNDPNGLVYFGGEYHLFYQYNPHSICWDSMHWGHAVSEDMIRWKNLPIAYTPEGPVDDYFSGSAVVDTDNTSGFFDNGPGMVAVFTHRDNGVQQQSIGYSQDGRMFYRFEPPIITNPGVEDFRDPKVVYDEKNGRYLLALAVLDHVEFFISKNLRTWSYLSQFGKNHGSHHGVWECPDLFELSVQGTDETRWVLVVGDQGASKTQYFVGHFDEGQFVSDDEGSVRLVIDNGVDNYAGQTFNDLPDDRRILIAWMNSTYLFNSTPTSPWRSVYTVPRELTLRMVDGKARLFQQPVRELDALREAPQSWQQVEVESSKTLLHIKHQMDIVLILDMDKTTAIQAGIKVFSGEKQEVIIGYDAVRKVVYVDRSMSGNMSYADNIPSVLDAPYLPEDGKVRLRILVDQSTVEVFTGDGARVIAALVFPEPDQDGVRLFARKGNACFEAVTIYPMRSIWQR